MLWSYTIHPGWHLCRHARWIMGRRLALWLFDGYLWQKEGNHDRDHHLVRLSALLYASREYLTASRCIGSILCSASQNVAMLVIGRFINGICVGIASAQVPVYIAELAPPSKRGRLVGAQQWAITWGILIMVCLPLAQDALHHYTTLFTSTCCANASK